MAAKEVQRTLIAEYVFPKGAEPVRNPAGRRLTFSSPQELDAAVRAGVVHGDEAMDAAVPVNDPQGEMADEQTGSGPAPEGGGTRQASAGRTRNGARPRKQPGQRYSKR